MKIIFYGTRDYDHLYFDVLAADPDYGCTIKFLAANLDPDTAQLAAGGDAVCAFVNSDCGAETLSVLAKAGIKLLLMRCAGYNNVDLAAAKANGITVMRVPGYSPEAVAEHAMALAQAANRRICKAYIKVRNNNFALDGLLGQNFYGACAGIVGTGRSDTPNQINNLLAFPGIFRGALDVRAREINEAMKVAAAQALADLIAPSDLSETNIIPSVFDKRVAPAVAAAVAEAARRTGCARV